MKDKKHISRIRKEWVTHSSKGDEKNIFFKKSERLRISLLSHCFVVIKIPNSSLFLQFEYWLINWYWEHLKAQLILHALLALFHAKMSSIIKLQFYMQIILCKDLQYILISNGHLSAAVILQQPFWFFLPVFFIFIYSRLRSHRNPIRRRPFSTSTVLKIPWTANRDTFIWKM